VLQEIMVPKELVELMVPKEQLVIRDLQELKDQPERREQ
tara:strand:- start:299 stop:415 length:117 start_codon:yes stop_codon:yes gene_type:complete